MRQAYDYWQNQPGNYLDRRSRPSKRVSHAGTPPEGSQSSSQGRGPFAQRRREPGVRPRGRAHEGAVGRAEPSPHPISPPEFPRTEVRHRDRPAGEGFADCDIFVPSGGYLSPITAPRRRRLSAEVYPRIRLKDNDSHRPTIHRLRHGWTVLGRTAQTSVAGPRDVAHRHPLLERRHLSHVRGPR